LRKLLITLVSAALTVAVCSLAPAQQPAGDPYNFGAWVNGVRARAGLAPLAYDPNLSAWAASNNAQQVARGMGHFVMGAARRQNSGMGALPTVCGMWLQSPGHLSALLDPAARWYGVAGSGPYWTFNAR
jgi:uncharacterized protein YkwD